METTGIDVHSQEYMEAMAALLSEAVSTDEGLKALAAAIAAPIDQEIKRKEITSPSPTRGLMCAIGTMACTRLWPILRISRRNP